MATVLITGGSGTIGKQLTHLLLQKGYSVIILTRKAKPHDTPNLRFAEWDIYKSKIDTSAIQSADYIIHLAGAGIADKRWTENRKKEIVESRVKSSQLLVKALQENDHHVKTVISASAIGYYGEDTPQSRQTGFREHEPSSTDFLGNTCRLWEESIQPVEKLGIRLVLLRTSIVLTKTGGALPEFTRPLKFGIAAILSSGEQIMSWIHVDDLCRMYLYAIENQSMRGPYNASAPETVTNKKFVLKLARQMRNNAYIAIHVPAFILKLLLGEMSHEILKSTTISDAAIKATGFQFVYPSVDSALAKV